jgi:hypothetical protein
MKKLISIFALSVLTALTVAAEDQHPKHAAKATTAAAHSKAPARGQSASAKSHGKKKGLSKQNSKQAKKNQKHGKFAWLKFPGHHKKQS